MIEQIVHDNKMLALIVRAEYKKEGLEFFTPNNFSQQLAYMNHPRGHKIQPHVHKLVPREVFFTKEVLFIRKGRVRIDFYNENQVYLESSILQTGDVVLLAFGGHGFDMLEDTEMIEVKQGPYAGDNDKVRFSAIDESMIKVRKNDTSQ